MECPTSITNLLNYGVLPEKWSELSVLLNETIISLEQLLLSYNLKELSIDVKEDYPFSSDRNAVIEKTKLSVISETLDSLKLLYNNLERWNNFDIHTEVSYHGRDIQKVLCKMKSQYDVEAILDPNYFKRIKESHPTIDLHIRTDLFVKLTPCLKFEWSDGSTQSFKLYIGRDIDCKMKMKLERIVKNCNETIDSLNNNAKSPYDLEAILDPDYFKQSLKTHPTNDPHGRAILFIELAQSELGIIKESSKTNEMQKVILTFYLDKLKTFNDQISSTALVTTTSKKKSKSKSNEIDKICEIIKKSQRVIKDVYGLMPISISKDYYDESDTIFNVINEKGRDAISQVCEFIEIMKTDWIERGREITTVATCRSSALRRLNVILKITKKLDSFKDYLESSYIIIGLKNIATYSLHINVTLRDVNYIVYSLTFNGSEPWIIVPSNFIRDDPVYKEIYEKPYNGLFIVYFHILKYYQILESLDWNPFQYRKPWKLTDYLSDIHSLIEVALNADFNHDESYKISLELADLYLMTKQKIHYDRETLAYRFDRFKPLKLYKFPEICSMINSQRIYDKELKDKLTEKFDGLISQLNRKVTNKGQLIVFERAMAMMKRSIYLFRIIRYDFINTDANKLRKQAVNEYFYAAEIVVKLLNLLRPNRRVTFSFSANGPFTKKIDSIGLKVKNEFTETVNAQIKTLKTQIRDKEADLESVKHEKTQLKYLQSILNRSKLIPIKELEITDKDNIDILREIIEEYEFTIINYGPVEVS